MAKFITRRLKYNPIARVAQTHHLPIHSFISPKPSLDNDFDRFFCVLFLTSNVDPVCFLIGYRTRLQVNDELDASWPTNALSCRHQTTQLLVYVWLQPE